MAKNKVFFTALLVGTALLSACQSSEVKEEFVTLDITRSYPEKQLTAQDFLDVEYIALETNDDFLTRGHVGDIGEKYIVMTNRADEGDIFFFDRKTGRALWKIDNKGDGPGEYAMMMGVILDEKREELFVNDQGHSKIHVYDLHGVHKRSFDYPENNQFPYVYDFDDHNLIGYNTAGLFDAGKPHGDRSFEVFFSKDDGSVTDNIYIPFDVIRSLVVDYNGSQAVMIPEILEIYHDGALISDTSSDTVYYYSPTHELKPFLAKTPNQAEDYFISMGVITRGYYFMSVTKREFTGRGFPTSALIYDRQEQALYTPVVFNADWPGGNDVFMYGKILNRDITVIDTLFPTDLIEALEADELQGPLKELASHLSEDDNPVLMIMKEKK